MISILVPNYNKAGFISDTLESLLKQTHTRWEALVVDDCSTDNSVEVIRDYASKDDRIKPIYIESNKGGAYCRNLALHKAMGDYIIFLDSDDILMPYCLESRVNFLQERSDLDFAVASMGTFYNNSDQIFNRWIPKKEHALKNFLAHDLPWSIMQPIWRTDFIKSFDGFDESFVRLQDVELHTRILLSKPTFQIIDGDFDCLYRIAPDRSGLSGLQFYQRFITGGIQFCNKFMPIVEKHLQKYLWATALKICENILGAYYAKRIESSEFKHLANHCLNNFKVNKANTLVLKIYLDTGALLRIHKPGLRRFMQALLRS